MKYLLIVPIAIAIVSIFGLCHVYPTVMLNIGFLVIVSTIIYICISHLFYFKYQNKQALKRLNKLEGDNDEN
ncbi:gp53 [Listeria phage P40]|uniref:gp53 n=1 Tax=Listeria phage P40 TaxID=560178 RepID=UPI0001819902|nr:gp53 [Listeria phage P40]ACI00413.1 gp53 [Listeria phage P40]